MAREPMIVVEFLQRNHVAYESMRAIQVVFAEQSSGKGRKQIRCIMTVVMMQRRDSLGVGHI